MFSTTDTWKALTSGINEDLSEPHAVAAQERLKEDISEHLRYLHEEVGEQIYLDRESSTLCLRAPYGDSVAAYVLLPYWAVRTGGDKDFARALKAVQDSIVIAAESGTTIVSVAVIVDPDEPESQLCLTVEIPVNHDGFGGGTSYVWRAEDTTRGSRPLASGTCLSPHDVSRLVREAYNVTVGLA